jgi:hypothetical protein
MRRVPAVAIAALVLGSCARAGQVKGSPSKALPDGFRRIVRTEEPPREFRCAKPSQCDVATIASWGVPRPRGSGEFQLVISLTFSYRLSGGDAAHLGISVSCPLTNPPAPCPTPVPTRTRPLTSHDGPMTTTMTWGLPPSSGPGSIVYFMATLDDRSGDGSVRLLSRHVTAVFEMWPS